MISGFGFRVSGFEFRISGLGIRDSGFWFLVSGFGFRISGFEIRISGFQFRVSVFGMILSDAVVREEGHLNLGHFHKLLGELGDEVVVHGQLSQVLDLL